MKSFTVETRQRSEFVNVSRQVQAAVCELGVKDGVITVFIPHTTAGVTINENADPDVVHDMQRALDKLVPWDDDYAHNEGNSAAHIKASMMGSSVRVLVDQGELKVGTWQSVYLCEFDGPRHRTVWVAAG